MPPLVAATVTTVVLATVVVVTGNVAVVAPVGTVTPGGVDATVESAESDTGTPPAGAGALNVTVPVEVDPPVMLEGLSVSDVSVDVGGGGEPGSTHRTGWSPLPSLQTVSCTGVDAVTGPVVTVNVALLAPAGIVTDAGTDATDGLPLVSVYTCPPAGAAFWMCTRPWIVPPPITASGVRPTAAKFVQVG